MTQLNSHKYNLPIAQASYLLKLPTSYIKESILDKDELTKDGNKSFIDDEVYMKTMRSWLNKCIKKKCVNLKQQYKYSKKLKNCGRQYAIDFGIQSLQNDLKGFLCRDVYNDYDMVNAYPCILIYIRNTYFKDMKTPFLDKYVSKRSEILSKWKIEKNDIFKCLNSQWESKTDNQFLKGLDNEFKIFQNKFYTSDIDWIASISKIQLNKDNKKGGFIARCVSVIEDQVIREVSQLFNGYIGSKIFDGLFIDKSLPIDEVLIKLNNATSKKYGINWINKPLSNKIQMDDDLILPEYEDEYSIMKSTFEETHFMINEPITFGRERMEDENLTFFTYGKSDFQTLTSTYQIDNSPFFNKWIMDINKRCYEKLVFDPSKEFDSNKYYNLFTGFNYEFNDIDTDNSVEIFLEHIKLLCNNDQDACKYLLNYIAHIIQYPEQLPLVAIVMCGSKGVGKDALIDIIEKLIGLKYSHRSNNFNDLFGNFTPALKHKLIIQLDEVAGLDGYKMKENLKCFITKTVVCINEKNVPQYKLNNYARLFLTSNNNNPIEVTSDNRRFFCIMAGDKREKSYYDNLYNMMNSSDNMNSIFNFLYDHDLEGFKTTAFPMTDKMKIMMEHNINPIYYYLKDRITKSQFISNQYIMDDYKNYLLDNGYAFDKINTRSLKAILINIPKNAITYKRTEKQRGYQIHYELLLPQLVKMMPDEFNANPQ